MQTLTRLALSACAMTAIMNAQTTEPIPLPIPGCHAKGVTMQTYYGNREDVLRAVRRSATSLNDFRMHLLFVESSTGAEALLYERNQDGQWDIKSWKGKSLGDVRHKLDAMVLRTRGSACAGEEMKLILATNQIELSGARPAKAGTMESILTPVLSSYPTGYLRVTVLDPCAADTFQVAKR